MLADRQTHTHTHTHTDTLITILCYPIGDGVITCMGCYASVFRSFYRWNRKHYVL